MSSNFTAQSIFNVEGHVAVVTGGGTGIGLMIAQAFANNGAKVYITGRRAEVLQQTAQEHGRNLAHPSGQIIPVQGDVGHKQGVLDLVKEISGKEKHVDILVNNAGIALKGDKADYSSAGESIEKLSESMLATEWDAFTSIFNTNVTNVYFTSAAFLPLLAKAHEANPQRTATIINTTSISGITKFNQGHVAYNASKAAANHITLMLATELATHAKGAQVPIRVNAIAPGIFPSEMSTKTSGSDNKSSIPADDTYREKQGIPAGRAGRDEDMASCALTLATNQYINGQVLVVDGGWLLGH